MVSSAFMNAAKHGEQYIKIDGTKDLRKDLEPGKKIICQHWKIRNAASECASYRTAHASKKRKKAKKQAKKHGVKRPAYGHQHRNVSRAGKKSGKPRNLGQWFTHQLESKKPLTHHRSKKKAVRKSKKKKKSKKKSDTAHKIALRAMKKRRK